MIDDDLDESDEIEEVPHRYWDAGWVVVGLIAFQCILLLSEQLKWFSFGRQKGYAVLLAGLITFLTLWCLAYSWVFCLFFRRNIQFSVRTMALVVLSVAIACDWFATELRQANDQYDARLWVASVEGQIFFEDEIESALEAHRPPNAAARPIEAPFGFDWLRGLIDRDFCANVVECGLENHFRVHGVHFSSGDEEDNIRPKVTAKGIKLLGRLPNLQRLTLESYKIEVNWLKDLKTLRELCLVDRRPDERRIAELKSIMPNTKISLLGE